MSYGKKIKQAQKRGNTARAERLTAKQAKRKSKRVTLYTPGKNNGSVKIGRKKFNQLATMNGDFGKMSGEPKFYRNKNGTPMNRTGSFYTESQNEALKTLSKKLGYDDFSGGNLGKAQRAINFSNPSVVQQVAAPVSTAAADGQSTSTSWEKQLASIKNEYAAENDRLSSALSDQQSAYDQQAADFQGSMNNMSNMLSSVTNAYDPTKNLGASNNINPALSIQEKNKSLSSGTQRYNRNSGLSIKNVAL